MESLIDIVLKGSYDDFVKCCYIYTERVRWLSGPFHELIDHICGGHEHCRLDDNLSSHTKARPS